MKKLIEKYVNHGINQDKIITTIYPSVFIWSKTRKCIVGKSTNVDPLELIEDKSGNKKLSYENNIMLSMKVRTHLSKKDINEINNSNGIVCTEFENGFRYTMIPN
jgi:hypothetical protein